MVQKIISSWCKNNDIMAQKIISSWFKNKDLDFRQDATNYWEPHQQDRHNPDLPLRPKRRQDLRGAFAQWRPCNGASSQRQNHCFDTATGYPCPSRASDS